MMYQCYASCSFGIEGVLAAELKTLGVQNVRAQDARVYFEADEQGVADANIFLRTADRVYIVLAEFTAKTFDELFEGVRSVPFADILPQNARFPVSANAVQSALMSVPDIQAVSKKAAVRAMQRVYRIDRFSENGETFHIFVNIHKDLATVALNASGAGLNRRGYRLKNVRAPIRETLAAALLLIARWHTREFHDPMCGSGTIAIEAAMLAANIAPGGKRGFDAEGYGDAFRRVFRTGREKAEAAVKKPRMDVCAGDINAENLKIAREHARGMGVGGYIRFQRGDARNFAQPGAPAAIITNPPYAERLGEAGQVERLYRDMGKAFLKLNDTVVFVLCAADHFEALYGAKADKKRKLYNGNLRCTYFQYFRK